MDPSRFGAPAAGRPGRETSLRITPEEIAGAARELVAAYGPAAIQLMKRRTQAVRRRGDAESAHLWLAVAEAVERELSAGAAFKLDADRGAAAE